MNILPILILFNLLTVYAAQRGAEARQAIGIYDIATPEPHEFEGQLYQIGSDSAGSAGNLTDFEEAAIPTMGQVAQTAPIRRIQSTDLEEAAAAPAVEQAVQSGPIRRFQCGRNADQWLQSCALM